MKQSEFKKRLEREEKIRLAKNRKFWSDLEKKPVTYTNLICKNIEYSKGFTCGHDYNDVFIRLWHCDKCGRRGSHCNKNSLKKKDIFIEERCDLEEG